MQNSLYVEKTNQNMELDPKVDISLDKNKSEFTNMVENVLDKGANYIIKGMPINDHIKDVLLDVKEAFKTKDFKEILKTAVGSSIREGLEILALPKEILNDLEKFKEVALKGGLKEGISAGIEIISKRFLGKNVYDVYIKDFFNKTKEFIRSNDFLSKLQTNVDRSLSKIEGYKQICKEWYKAYDEFDLEKLNTIASDLNNKKSKIRFDLECVNQNNVIQNMTRLINNKKDKLTELQMQICNSI